MLYPSIHPSIQIHLVIYISSILNPSIPSITSIHPFHHPLEHHKIIHPLQPIQSSIQIMYIPIHPSIHPFSPPINSYNPSMSSIHPFSPHINSCNPSIPSIQWLKRGGFGGGWGCVGLPKIRRSCTTFKCVKTR